MRDALKLSHQNESIWQACLQGSQDAVMVLERRNDLMGRFMGYTVAQANEQAHRLFGPGEQPLVGQLLKDVLPEGQHDSFHTRVKLAAESNQAQVDEQSSPSPDQPDRQRWLHHQIIPLSIGIALISRDTTEVHESIQAVREKETFYRSAINSLPMAVYARSARAGKEGRFIAWNRQTAEIMQMPAEHVLGRKPSEVLPAEIARRGEAHDQLVIQDPRTHFFQNLSFKTAHGDRLVDLIKTPVYGVDGKLDHILSIATDVTESRRAAEQLKLASRVMEETADGVVVTDSLDRIVMVNHAFLKMVGLNQEAAIGQSAELLGMSPLRESHLPGISEALHSGQRWSGECSVVGADGKPLETWLAVTTLRGEDQRVTQHIRVLTDISVLKAQQRALSEQARRDILTGLPNRRVFSEHLRQAMARARRHPQTLAVMYVDLDGFKAVNDRLGHAAGDKLLVEVAARLEAAVRKTDCVCRLAGDEFTIILEGAGHPSEVRRVGQRILEQLSEPCHIGQETVWPAASLGAAVFEAHDSQDSLCQRADAAMYRAKHAGKGRFVLDGDSPTPLSGRGHGQTSMRLSAEQQRIGGRKA
jgi:diguanylate cyclase (GGDEF)-like protein/PAS domain S-box-containing protein